MASYWHEGRRHLNKALATLEQPAVIADLEEDDVIRLLLRSINQGGPYTVQTRRRYREDLKLLICVIARARGRDLGWAEFAVNLLDEAMRARRAPRQPKPALATAAEVRAIFGNLRARYVASMRLNLALAAFMMMVIQQSGIRPVEIPFARVEDGNLIVPNAKRREGDPAQRIVPLSNLPSAVIEIYPEVLAFFDYTSQFEFDRFRNRLAETLARACKRSGVRRLSFYSFRRLRLSIWIESGVIDDVVAVLAGHVSIRTAKRSYRQPVPKGWAPDRRQAVDFAAVPEVDHSRNEAPTEEPSEGPGAFWPNKSSRSKI